MKTRREFIKTSTIAVLGGTMLKPDLFAAPPLKKSIIGLQLYSIRDEMKNEPLESLKQVAHMGYKYVEHANYVDRKFYGYEAKAFKKVLDDLGLQMVSGHTAMRSQHWDEAKKDFSDSWKWTIEDAAILEQKYVVSPSMDNSMRSEYDSFMRYMDVFNRCGELCRKYGMKFGYHNHDYEFSEKLRDKKLFDIIMDTIVPQLVVIQLDTGNLYSGGAIAADVVKQYPGRFENIHVKDVIEATAGRLKYESCILGEGIADIRNVIDAAVRNGGTEVMIIEQEAYQGKAPMECVKENLQIMKDWGYIS
jgi:sugar phosphate isomerase/epimerase